MLAFGHLDAPPVVGTRNWITPPDEVEDAFFLFPSDLLDAVHQRLQPLPGCEVNRAIRREAWVRRSKVGV
jgi:2-oxoisovalerate dehydrogenase E1 component